MIELIKLTNKWIEKEDYSKIYYADDSKEGVIIGWYKQSSENDDVLIVIEFYDLFKQNYIVMEKLFEWHFDVFKLIPEGLALDINTL